jgi:hypothetical protein
VRCRTSIARALPVHFGAPYSLHIRFRGQNACGKDRRRAFS